jgi:hypothetical protein
VAWADVPARLCEAIGTKGAAIAARAAQIIAATFSRPMTLDAITPRRLVQYAETARLHARDAPCKNTSLSLKATIKIAPISAFVWSHTASTRMDLSQHLSQVLSIKLTEALTVGAAIISILGFIGTIWVKHSSSKSLERAKAHFQEDLERRKGELQADLEERKTGLQKELEEFKAGLTEQLAVQNARRSYEYDAKRRLYVQVEPLLFQLFEAAEGAFHAVTSLARTQRKKHLPEWLADDADKYYIRSIIHRLFLPLAILRLIQRTTTHIDLTLDPSIRLRYALLKESYLTWTDDFGLADVEPELTYDPNKDDWSKLRKADRAKYWRQGLVIGELDRLVDAMTVAESSPQRAMNFGEWELAVSNSKELKPAFGIVEDIFIGFEFHDRPVLGRVLISYACMMHTLMSIYGKPAERVDLAQLVSGLSVTDNVSGLKWWKDGEPDAVVEVLPYVLARCQQAMQGEYARF